jgi:hypothetical protein
MKRKEYRKGVRVRTRERERVSVKRRGLLLGMEKE